MLHNAFDGLFIFCCSTDCKAQRKPFIELNRALLLCFPLQNPVDDEEHLDYSSGSVTLITDLKSWEKKLEDATDANKTVSSLQPNPYSGHKDRCM